MIWAKNMQENNRTDGQQLDGSQTDRLWSWKFELADWIGMTVASLLFIAFITLLFTSPEIVERSRMMPSAPLAGVLITSIGLILKPRSNTTRIPAVYLILLSIIAIAINWSIL